MSANLELATEMALDVASELEEIVKEIRWVAHEVQQPEQDASLLVGALKSTPMRMINLRQQLDTALDVAKRL